MKQLCYGECVCMGEAGSEAVACCSVTRIKFRFQHPSQVAQKYLNSAPRGKSGCGSAHLPAVPIFPAAKVETGGSLELTGQLILPNW